MWQVSVYMYTGITKLWTSGDGWWFCPTRTDKFTRIHHFHGTLLYIYIFSRWSRLLQVIRQWLHSIEPMKSFVYPASPVHQREKEKERDSGDSMASSKRRKAVKDVENRCFKDEWMEKCMYILPADSSKPVCLICSNSNQKKKKKKGYLRLWDTIWTLWGSDLFMKDILVIGPQWLLIEYLWYRPWIYENWIQRQWLSPVHSFESCSGVRNPNVLWSPSLKMTLYCGP